VCTIRGRGFSVSMLTELTCLGDSASSLWVRDIGLGMLCGRSVMSTSLDPEQNHSFSRTNKLPCHSCFDHKSQSPRAPCVWQNGLMTSSYGFLNRQVDQSRA